MSMTDKPLPTPNAETRPFWEAAAQGVLRIQRCEACGTAQFPPRAICGHCHARGAPAWVDAQGTGVIASHTTVHRPPSPAFKADLPYTLALVTLDEGPRILVSLRGDAARAPAIGLPVVIRFEAPAGPHGIALPYAILAETAA